MVKTRRFGGRLAEVIVTYGIEGPAAPHDKISISLPNDLVEQVRAAAAESGVSVSAVIAAAIRSSVATAEQKRLDAAIEAQNEENLERARGSAPIAAEQWSKIEW